MGSQNFVEVPRWVLLAAQMHLVECAESILALSCFFATGSSTHEFALWVLAMGKVPSQWPCLMDFLEQEGQLDAFQRVSAA